MNQPLLLSLLLPSVLLARGDTPVAAEVVRRVHDVAAVAPSVVAEAGECVLLPALGRDFEEDSGAPRERATDVLAEWLVLASGDEFELEGRSWTLLDGALHVAASAPAHERIERELAFFGEVFRSAVTVRIDVVDGDLGAQGQAARVPAQAAEELVARAAAQGRVRSTLLRLAPGDAVRVDHTREVRVVTDYDVEVANQALVYHPLPRSIRIGTRLVASAAAVGDGVQLALVLRESAELAPPRERTLGFVNMVTGEFGVNRLPFELTFQSPHVVQHAEALTTVLPRGEAVLLRSTLETAQTTARCTIVLRALGEPPPAARGLALYANGYRVDVLDLSRFAPPRVEVSGTLLEPSLPLRVLDAFYNRETWEGETPFVARIASSEDELELARERLVGDSDGVTAERFGPWLLLQPAELDAAAKYERNYDPEAVLTVAQPKTVELDVTLRRGDAKLARWSAPLLLGARSAFSVGAERLGVESASVEIAQSASTFDPLERDFFDGLVVALEPRRLADGALDLAVTARAIVLDGEPVWASGMVGQTPPIDRASASTLMADERVVIPAAEPRTAVLGLAGKGGLVLEIAAR